MRSSVETVFTYPVFFIHLVRYRVEISFRAHSLVERRIKDAYHRNSRHQFLTSSYSCQIRRVVKRRKFGAFFESRDDII